MRHLIAAWLNAGFFSNYPITKAQVADMWQQLVATGFYCPSGMSCGSKAMSAEQVKAYVEGMYDYNAGIENDLCKQ